MSVFANGFAAAVQPVQVQTTVSTDAQGLEAGEVSIPVRDGAIAAYCARPAGTARLPTIVLVHEIWSVHEYFRDLCRRLAKAGYLAVAPDLYGRQGDVSEADIDAVRAVVARVPEAQAMADLDATVAWAGSHGGDITRLGVTGFCWGGRITWMYAAHNRTVKAAVAWYGPLVKPATPLAPRHPVDVAQELTVPVLGLYAGADAGIPNDTVDRMRAALRAAGSHSQIVSYPGMPHGFHADYRPTYRREAAEDGWKRMLEWFRGHGVA